MVYQLTALFVVISFGAVWAYVLWNCHKPGERLWYICMGEVILGPIPISTMILGNMDFINLNATMTPWQIFLFWSGFFLYIILPAIIGEIFNL